MPGTIRPDLSPRVYEYRHSLFALFAVTDEALEPFLDIIQEQGSAELPAMLYAQSERRECRNPNSAFETVYDTQTGRPRKEVLTGTDAVRVIVSSLVWTKPKKYSEHEEFPRSGSFFSVYTELPYVKVSLTSPPNPLMGPAHVLRTLSSLLTVGQCSTGHPLTFLKPARYGMSQEAFANMHNVGKFLIGTAISTPTLEAVPKTVHHRQL